MKEINLNKIATHPLQTSQWASFRREWGNEILLSPWGLITIHKIPFLGKRLGIFEKGPKPDKKMLDGLFNISKEQKLIFIKLESNFIPNNQATKDKLTGLLQSTGCVEGKTLFTPTTFWVDLTKPENELLASFHSKTRYNVRYAEKKGVKVEEDNSGEAFKTYLKLTFETAKRQRFYAHSEKYHRLMWEYLHTKMVKKGLKPIARLLTAKYQGKILTTWIVFVWKDFLYYPYGASSSQMQNLQANSAMMWGAIKYGKKLGLKTFDLWGREPGKGFTRFKEGFNPKIIEFLGSWDLVTNKPIYTFYRFAEKVRWFLLKGPLRLFFK